MLLFSPAGKIDTWIRTLIRSKREEGREGDRESEGERGGGREGGRDEETKRGYISDWPEGGRAREGGGMQR